MQRVSREKRKGIKKCNQIMDHKIASQSYLRRKRLHHCNTSLNTSHFTSNRKTIAECEQFSLYCNDCHAIRNITSFSVIYQWYIPEWDSIRWQMRWTPPHTRSCRYRQTRHGGRGHQTQRNTNLKAKYIQFFILRI